MTMQTKTIGRMPTDHGPYDPNLAYGKKFQCSLFGCAWESLHDNNNTAPAVWDGGDTITPNLVDWKKVSGDYNAWLMNNDKPAASMDYPYNGMGRITIPKNIQVDTSVDPAVTTNILDPALFNKANTVYVIKYDFTLGGNITMPANCVLEFDGGSIKNATGNSYKVTGTKTKINTDVAYNIFDDTLGGGFELPYIDLRWVGGVSDYNEQTGSGTDNTFAFTRAINIIGQYYNGMHIHLVGQYVISTTVSTTYDLNVFGEHTNSRIYSAGDPKSDVTSPSLLAVNCTDAFILQGRGSADFIHFNIKNIKVIGTANNYTQNFLKIEAAGAPGRVCVVEECEFTKLNNCIYTPVDANATVANVTLEKNVAYLNNCFVNLSGSTNLKIKDSNIEGCGGSDYHAIELHNAGITVIDNNILESNPDCIYIRSSYAAVSIINNYFESNTGYVIDIEVTNSRNSPVEIHNSSNAANPIKVRLSNITLSSVDFGMISFDSVISTCHVDELPEDLPLSALKEYICVRKVSDMISTTSNFHVASILKDGKYLTRYFNTTEETREEIKTSESNKTAFMYIYNPEDDTLGIDINIVLQGAGTSIYNKSRVLSGKEATVFPIFVETAGTYSVRIKRTTASKNVTPPVVFIGDLRQNDIVVPTVNTRFMTTERPKFDKPVGYSMYSINEDKEIWWTGDTSGGKSGWVDASGADVPE